MDTKFINIILASFLLLVVGSAKAQMVNGLVTDGSKTQEPLPGASVYWAGTTTGTITDIDGKFTLSSDEWPRVLVVSFVGYESDSTRFETAPTKLVTLKLNSSAVNSEGVTIVGETTGTTLSTMDPIITEQINIKELQKAACCNLSESFETNASVDVVVADAVSGTKKIRMLGLDGIYTQLQTENVPSIRGLSASTGLTQVPGTWIESIQISKGAGSVVNGHESMTGQINLEFMKPDKADKLYLNAYGNAMGRLEMNAQYATKVNEKWGSNFLLHGSGASLEVDRNDDGFLDGPVYHSVNFFNRWRYTGDNRMAQIMLKVVDDSRRAGQTGFNFDEDFGQQQRYGIGIDTRQYELIVKNGFLFENDAFKSVGVIAKLNHYQLDTYFGNRKYVGTQNSAYLNVIFQDALGTTAHSYKAGTSFRYDNFDQALADSGFAREEIVPGAFAEYSFDNSENFSAILGLRGDYHNLFGAMITPRVHLKWNPKPLWAFRLSGGSGFRTPNAIADNLGVLASSRRVVIEGDLQVEESWNYGASLQRKFEMFGREASFVTDFFRTDFTNQLVMDLDRSAREVVFYNLEGSSYANAFQAELALKPFKSIDLRLAYKYTDVKVTYDGELKERPFIPRERALISIGWKNFNEIWQVDLTSNFFGDSRLPNTLDNPVELQLEERSELYLTQHLQITKQFRWFEIYGGAENLFDYKQDRPILSADDPFGLHFDASMVWGPVQGRVIYGGIRYKIK